MTREPMKPVDTVVRSAPNAGPTSVGPSAGTAPVATAPDRTADEICRDVRLGARAKKLLVVGMKPGQFLTLMVEHRLYADAIRYMAHALLNREAVWWACPVHPARGLRTSRRWPASQREALGPRSAGYSNPRRPTGKRRLARSQRPAPEPRPAPPRGSRVRPGSNRYARPRIDAPSPILARMAGASVLLAAKSSARLRRFITLGLDVAYGENRWD